MPRNKKRRPAQRPRKPLKLGDTTREITFYVVRFMAKVPDELREGTDAPEWIKRESPPTLDEDAARDAYREVVDQLHLGMRSPQLLVRTVTENVLLDHDADHGNPAGDADLADRLGDANAQQPDAGADDPVEAVLDALAAEAR